jgi:hypothetical protein
MKGNENYFSVVFLRAASERKSEASSDHRKQREVKVHGCFYEMY